MRKGTPKSVLVLSAAYASGPYDPTSEMYAMKHL